MHDRTEEYLRAVNLYRPPNQPNQQFRRPEPSDFTVGAKRVSFVLNDLEKLIASLNKLVKQKDLFRDPTAQINEITQVFKRDLNTVNSELDKLRSAPAMAKQMNLPPSHRRGVKFLNILLHLGQITHDG